MMIKIVLGSLLVLSSVNSVAANIYKNSSGQTLITNLNVPDAFSDFNKKVKTTSYNNSSLSMSEYDAITQNSINEEPAQVRRGARASSSDAHQTEDVKKSNIHRTYSATNTITNNSRTSNYNSTRSITAASNTNYGSSQDSYSTNNAGGAYVSSNDELSQAISRLNGQAQQKNYKPAKLENNYKHKSKSTDTNILTYKDNSGRVLLTHVKPTGNFEQFNKRVETTYYKNSYNNEETKKTKK